jgi:hypothetical protein
MATIRQVGEQAGARDPVMVRRVWNTGFLRAVSGPAADLLSDASPADALQTPAIDPTGRSRFRADGRRNAFGRRCAAASSGCG